MYNKVDYCCPLPHSLPSGSSGNLTARRGAPSCTDGTDGLDGWDGDQKCPLIFFIFCGYIDTIYFYLYTKRKLSPTFLWVSKFDVKLGVVIQNFKFTAGR